MSGKPAVFLDRDGILIRMTVRDGKPYAVTPAETPTMFDDVEHSCRALSAAGFLLVMVTNQPDIKRGITTRAFVDETNRILKMKLALDDLRICYHDNEDRCDCRKPKPGLLLGAASDLGLDLDRSFVIGDRQTDILAGKQAGCRTVFVDRGYHGETSGDANFVAQSLGDAVRWILSAA